MESVSDERLTVVGMGDVYSFSAELWQYEGPDPWHFICLPPELSDDIRAKHAPEAAGFGSLKVEASVGSTRWATSLFRDKGRQVYLLPVKKSVRIDQDLKAGDVIAVTVRLTR